MYYVWQSCQSEMLVPDFEHLIRYRAISLIYRQDLWPPLPCTDIRQRNEDHKPLHRKWLSGFSQSGTHLIK